MDEGSTPSSSTVAGARPAGHAPVFIWTVAGRRSALAGSRGFSHRRFIRQDGLRVFPFLLLVRSDEIVLGPFRFLFLWFCGRSLWVFPFLVADLVRWGLLGLSVPVTGLVRQGSFWAFSFLLPARFDRAFHLFIAASCRNFSGTSFWGEISFDSWRFFFVPNPAFLVGKHICMPRFRRKSDAVPTPSSDLSYGGGVIPGLLSVIPVSRPRKRPYPS